MHPLDAIPPGRRARVFVPLLLATLTLTVALRVIDRPLQTPASPNGIVSFELAGDLRKARAMIDAWDPRARIYAGLSLGLDYLYMVTYSTTIALACLWAAGVLRRRGWPLVGLGAPLGWGQWVAAACDGVENFALIVQLVGTPAAPWPAVAWTAASVKFALIVAGLAYALLGAVARVLG